MLVIKGIIMPVKLSQFKFLLFLIISNLFFTKQSIANDCEVLYPNESVEITTHMVSVCVTFKSIHVGETFIVPDKSVGISADYLSVVKNKLGSTIFTSQISSEDLVNSKLNSGIYDEVTVTLYPRTDLRKYTFTVVNIDTPEGTLIYIGLNASESPIQPDPCPRNNCGGVFSLQSNISMMSGATISNEAPQCSDLNRPPTEEPTHIETGTDFHLNRSLADARNWSIRVQESGLPPSVQSALILARVVSTMQINGYYDFSHGDSRSFDGTESYGNFFFAAQLRAMYVQPTLILRGSAAYQAISNVGGFSSAEFLDWGQAVLNYTLQSGDDIQDSEDLLRGIRYVDEVFENNPNDTRSSSCENLEAVNGGGSGGIGGIGGGGDGSSSGTGGSSGSLEIGSGGSSGRTQVCLVQNGVVRYCWYE